MPSFLMIQWGIVGFFVIIHFLIGFLRGSSKSLYFTIVSLVMTVVTLLIVANISLNWIFSMFSISTLVGLAQTYTGNLGIDSYLAYLEDPAITGFIIAILDLIIRIIAFVIFYPIIKFFLTLAIFKPIWKHGIKKALLKKQNQNAEDEFISSDTSNKKFVPSRRLNKGVFGRLFGGAMGAVRGFVVAFIFLIPIIVIAGFASNVSDALPDSGNTNISLDNGEQQLVAIPSEIQTILDNINEMNQSGLGSMTKSITIGGKSIDRYIFDQVFTTKVVDATDQVTSLNFGEELEGIVGIVGILMDGGYLDDNFDYNTIDSSNLEDIEQIFTYISQSDVLNYLIPFAIREGLPVALSELTDYENPYDRPDTAAALEVFASIDWSVEFMNFYGIIEATLEFGSVEDLMAYAANPNTLLELTPEEAVLFTNILRSFGDMESLVLINAGLDYATTLDQFKSAITWVEPDEVEAYIANRLGFIIDNPDFFIGEDGEISKLADLIEIFFSEDVDLPALVDSISDPGAFLDAQDPEWVGEVFDKVVGLDLLIQAIPMGVDYGLYTFLGDQVEATLADEITTALDAIEWDAEIINVGNIYAEVLQLGISSFLGTETDTFGLVDQVVVNHMDSVRTIVESIFEGSELVNVAIEIASPAIVDKFVTDPALKDLVNEALISDPVTGVVDFSFGAEVNSMLTILESVYGFTTASELGSFSTMTLDQKVELFSKFGSLTALEYTAFEDAFQDLQILDRMGASALTYAKDTLAIEQLYVPTEVDLGHDVSSILGLAYYAAKYTYDNSLDYDSYEEIDYAPLLADDTFRSYLLSTTLENHSNLLFTSIAYNIQLFSEDESLSNYVAIPTTLATLSPEDALWETEVNAFLGAILDLGASFDGSPVMSLSVLDVLSLKDDTSTASLELFTQFADPVKAEEAFGSLDSSQILRTSLVNIINTLGESTLDSMGYALTVPAIALDGEMLSSGMIVELINGLAVVAQDAFETMSVTTLAEFNALEGTSDYLNAFSQLEDASIDALSGITIIRGMVSDALLNPDMQAFLVDTINSAQALFVIDADFFDVDPILLDAQGALKAEEVSALFIAVRSLGITDSEVLGSIGLETFTGLIGRNIDPVSGEDDFDRVFGSGYLYITLDKIIQLDAIGTFVSDALTTSLGSTVSGFDLTLPIAMLGNTIDNELIEVDRIPLEEFRRIVISVGLLGDLSTIGIDTFSSLVDPSLPEDDFTTFIASDFIYVVLARLFDNPGFGDYVNDMLSGAFGDNPITLDMAVPTDAKGTSGVEDTLITRVELRNIMISFDLLDIGSGTTPSVATLMNMIDPVENPDDMTLFLRSIYISDKISQLLLSEAITDLILAGTVTHTEFVDNIPAISITSSGRLTSEELYNIFNGLNVLGIDDLGSGTSSIGIDTVTSLDSAQIDELLLSGYLYSLIDVMIKDQAATLGLPADAFETSGDYITMIKASEIKNLLNAFDVLGTSDPSTISVDSITIAKIIELLDLDSPSLDQLMSDGIIDALGSAPQSAYNIEGTRLSRSEMYNVTDVLLILSEDGFGVPNDQMALTDLTPINTTDITRDVVRDFYNLDSRLIDRILSTSIIDSGISIHSLSYALDSELDSVDNHKLDLDRTELLALIDALDILEIDISNASAIDTSTFTPAKIDQLLDLGSPLIYRLVSEGIIDQGLETVESLAVDGVDMNYDPIAPGSDIKPEEMKALVQAMMVLGITNLSIAIDVNGVTVDQLRDTHYLGLGTDPVTDTYESRIIHRLLSDAIDNAVTVPDDAYMSVDMLDMLPGEVGALIEALAEMGLTTLTDPIDVNTLTVTQLRNIHYLGLGVDPVTDTYQSLTINRLISESVVTAVTIPDDAYMTVAQLDVKPLEIGALIEALDVMGLANLGDPIDVNALTVAQLRNIHYLGLGIDPVLDTYESLTINRLISESVVTAVTIPDDAYMTVAQLDVKPLEIGALIEALDVMGLATLGDPIDVNAITVAQLRNIHYLGLGIDPILDTYESLTINRLISESVILAVTIPDDAYMLGTILDVKPEEISALIEALDEMGVATLGAPIDVNAITVAQLRNIHYLGLGTNPVTDIYESLTINRLISESVILAVTIPDDAYMTVAQLDVKPLEISALIEALDEMGVATLGDPIDVNAITVAQLRNIHYLGLGTNPVTDIYESLTINRLISESVILAVTIPDDAYMLGTILDVKPEEISALIEALDEMGVATLGDPIDVNAITVTQLRNIHYLGLGVDPVTDTYQSLTINRLISESVILAVTIPDDAYLTVAQLDVKPLEIGALIESLDVMGLTTLGDPINVDSLTVAQLQSLHYIGLGTDPVTEVYDSFIIHHLISDGITTILTNVPSTIYMASGDIVNTEVQGVISAIGILNTNPLATLGTMSFANGGLTPAKIESLLDLNSLIIDRQISEGIRTATLDVPEAYALVGETNYDASYVPGDLSIPEMYALVEAMNIMGISDLTGSFDPNTITVANLQSLHYVGLGTDPVTDTYDSYMVHHLISDGIAGTLTNRPSTVYMGNGDITAVEIQGVISAIGILNTNPLATLGTMSFANGGLTPAKIESLLDLNSLIIDRQISEGIRTATLDVPEAYALVGETNYDASYVPGDLSIPEMYALVEAMNIMGISDLTGSFDPSSITVANLQALHYVGLGTDPVTDTYDSYMVHHMISDGIAGTLTNRPSTVYMTNGDITAVEIQGVISAIGILNSNPLATLGTMSFANGGLTPAKITALLDLNSLIIDRQISEGIISANLDVPEAFALVGETNYDPSYLVPGDLKIDEMYAVVEAMDIMGLADLSATFSASDLTTAQLQELHYIGLGTDPVTELYDSYIVHSIISDSLVLVNPQTIAYDANGYVKAIEIQGFIDNLNILGVTTISSFAAISDSSGILSVFTDAATPIVFANSAANSLTLMYYFVDSILDPGDNTIPFPYNTRTTDAYGFTAVIRSQLSAFIIAFN